MGNQANSRTGKFSSKYPETFKHTMSENQMD